MFVALAAVVAFSPLALPISAARQCTALAGQSEPATCDAEDCTLCVFGVDTMGQQALYDTSILYRCPAAVQHFLRPQFFTWCAEDEATDCYCQHLGGEIVHPYEAAAASTTAAAYQPAAALCRFRDGSFIGAATLLHGREGAPGLTRALIHNGCARGMP